MTNDITQLRHVIKQLHGCDSEHIESLAVKELFRNHLVWNGMVELFKLIGHPKAERCYAWSHKQDDGGDNYITVLEIPPVNSALSAVRAGVVAASKKNT